MDFGSEDAEMITVRLSGIVLLLISGWKAAASEWWADVYVPTWAAETWIAAPETLVWATSFVGVVLGVLLLLRKWIIVASIGSIMLILLAQILVFRQMSENPYVVGDFIRNTGLLVLYLSIVLKETQGTTYLPQNS